MASQFQVDTLLNAAGTDGPAVTGVTAGTSAAAGIVGAQVTDTVSSTTATTVANTAVDVKSFSVPAGRWLVLISCSCDIVTANGAGANTTVNGAMILTDNSNSALAYATLARTTQSAAGADLELIGQQTIVHYLTVASTTTYKLRAVCDKSTATGHFTVFANGTAIAGGVVATSTIRLVRL